MIVITGATGQLGSQIVQQLALRVPADRIGLSVRDTSKAPAGFRVRRGDFTDPASLSASFADATQVLIVSANDTGDSAVAAHTAAVDAARGAERILYTSHQAVAPDSLFDPMRDHFGTEQYLASTGRPHTALRNGVYASTVPMLLGRALETGELIAPADGPVSWTTHADLAEAAAIILAGEAAFDGPTPPLTGSEALDLADVAAILTDLTGRPIRRVVADDQEWSHP